MFSVAEMYTCVRACRCLALDILFHSTQRTVLIRKRYVTPSCYKQKDCRIFFNVMLLSELLEGSKISK